MKVLVMGGSGMLGHQLCDVFRARFTTVATFRGDTAQYQPMPWFHSVELLGGVDASDLGCVRDVIERTSPDVVINAIGVVKQGLNGKNPDVCRLINQELPHHIAALCAKIGARFIGISTDCVFSGANGRYTEADVADADDVYGKSKFMGEVTEGDALTIRTSIIGRELAGSQGLVEWFLANRGGTVRGFSKAIFSGFPTVELADILSWIIAEKRELRGLYHLSAEPISKFELLNLVNRAYSAGVQIEEEADFRIDRSLDSSRFRKHTGFAPRSWEEMVQRMFEGNSRYEEWRKQ